MNNIDLEKLQGEVQLSFGLCMLRLQEYELLLKPLVTNTEIKGTVSQWEKAFLERTEKFATDTLGELISYFLKFHVKIEGAIEEEIFIEPIESIDEPMLGFRSTIQMSESNYARTGKELEELRLLRNNLAHHFLQKFDIKTIDGCSKAHVYLSECLSVINTHFSQMQTWIDSFTTSQRMMASFMRTETVSNLFINGIAPDGKVHWPIAGIVAALREAAEKLNINGWTNLHEARALIEAAEPEQTPAKYHCSTWKQVLNDSGIFKIEYRQNKNEAKQAWYSELSGEANKAL